MNSFHAITAGIRRFDGLAWTRSAAIGRFGEHRLGAFGRSSGVSRSMTVAAAERADATDTSRSIAFPRIAGKNAVGASGRVSRPSVMSGLKTSCDAAAAASAAGREMA